MSRQDTSGISGRSRADIISDDAKFSRIETVSNTIFHATGSARGTSGFIIATAGNTKLIATEGGEIAASELNTKTLYEIGVQQVSGSGKIHLVY